MKFQVDTSNACWDMLRTNMSDRWKVERTETISHFYIPHRLYALIYNTLIFYVVLSWVSSNTVTMTLTFKVRLHLYLYTYIIVNRHHVYHHSVEQLFIAALTAFD
jgi:hypothetical protein